MSCTSRLGCSTNRVSWRKLAAMHASRIRCSRTLGAEWHGVWTAVQCLELKVMLLAVGHGSETMHTPQAGLAGSFSPPNVPQMHSMTNTET